MKNGRELEIVAYYPVAYRADLAYVPELAGRSILIRESEHQVELRLPRPGEPSPVKEYVVQGRFGSDPDVEAFSTRAIRARVQFRAEMTLPAGPDHGDRGDRFQDDLDRAENAARRAVARFRRWTRLGQPWVGLPDEELHWIEPLEVRDIETGETIPDRPRGIASGITIVGGPYLTSRDVDAIERDLEQDTSDEFLADARFLSHWSLAPAYSQAVIAAAASCELKIKKALVEKAEGTEAAELLDVMLGNPRSFPQAAHELFDSVSEAIFGKSLRKTEKPLFKELRVLFERRNAIAHRGTPIGEEESANLVRTAIAVGKWVDEIRKPNRKVDSPE